MPNFEIDPGVVDSLLRGLCPGCRGDRAFTRRTDGLTEQFRKDLAAVLREAS
jgi:hypothetical protein